MLRILVVEDVPNMQARVVDFLTQRLSGYEVTTASNRAEALQRIAEEAPNLVLLDLVIPPDGTTTSGAWTEGRAVLRCVKEQCPHVKVIALTGQGELARDFLLEEGADDFFTKDSREEWAQEKMALQLDALLGYLVCRSPAMQSVRAQLGGLAEEDGLIVLQGEAGTGKRYVAGLLHRNSRRSLRRLEMVSCAALAGPQVIPLLWDGGREQPGLLRQPDVGTVVLHDLDDLPADAQPPLAALLCDFCSPQLPLVGSGRRAVPPAAPPARLVLCVRSPLADLQAAGRLTTDLLLLLSPAHGGAGRLLALPPLRDRREDLPDLAHHFRRKYSRIYRSPAMQAVEKPVTRIHPHCLKVLEGLDYPGHVAQLERIVAAGIRRAEGDTLLAKHLEVDVPGEYHVIYSRGAGREEAHVSFKDLSDFLDHPDFELAVCLGLKEGHPVVESITVAGQPVTLADERLLKLLLLLLTHAGERVEVSRHKRDLGLAPAERLRRYIFALRKALGDTEVHGTSSKFLTSHWGEACTFHADARFCLIRLLPPE